MRLHQLTTCDKIMTINIENLVAKKLTKMSLTKVALLLLPLACQVRFFLFLSSYRFIYWVVRVAGAEQWVSSIFCCAQSIYKWRNSWNKFPIGHIEIKSRRIWKQVGWGNSCSIVVSNTLKSRYRFLQTQWWFSLNMGSPLQQPQLTEHLQFPWVKLSPNHQILSTLATKIQMALSTTYVIFSIIFLADANFEFFKGCSEAFMHGKINQKLLSSPRSWDRKLHLQLPSWWGEYVQRYSSFW